MPDRFVHVLLSDDEDPLALTKDLVRWLEETYPDRVSDVEADAGTEILIRIRTDQRRRVDHAQTA
jgi:hypothetical protein